MELRSLLQRPGGTGGPLELVSAALCSAKGPSSPGALSLNWYEAGDLRELVGQDPAPALPDKGLSECMACFPIRGVGQRAWGRASQHPHPRPCLL